MTKTHTRRTPEQIVADYEAKIAAVKARAAAKEAKASPDGAAFLGAVRGLQKAQRVAEEQGNEAMDQALVAALAGLSKHAVEAGMRMPEPRERKGGRRKKAAAA